MPTMPTAPNFDVLNGIPPVNIPQSVQTALATGRRASEIAAEAVALRFSPGKISPQEYFYYRLWDERVRLGPAKAFVGKMAQHPMHVAAGSREWFAASADKILFHSIMMSARYRVPQNLAITQIGRHLPDIPTMTDADDLASFLRDPSLYPLFAKQVAGKYSLSVVSADSYDASSDEVVQLSGERRTVGDLAVSLVGGAGYMIQRRLKPAQELADRFGPRLWSARLLVFVTPDGPTIHRAAAKIATGVNAADNYWRAGNRLGAIDIATGNITRVVCGTGLTLEEDGLHPDTQQPIVGTTVPNWAQIVHDVRLAAQTFAGIRTQSWDIALTGVLVSAADANVAGDRYADRHAALAAGLAVRFERLRPPQGQDWNDVLVAGRGA